MVDLDAEEDDYDEDEEERAKDQRSTRARKSVHQLQADIT